MSLAIRTLHDTRDRWYIPRKPLTARPPRQKLMRKTPVKNEIVKVLSRGIPLTTVPLTPCQSTVSCGNGWAHLMVPHEHADPLTPCQSTVTCGNGCAHLMVCAHRMMPHAQADPLRPVGGCQDRGIHPTALPGPGPVTAPGNKCRSRRIRFTADDDDDAVPVVSVSRLLMMMLFPRYPFHG